MAIATTIEHSHKKNLYAESFMRSEKGKSSALSGPSAALFCLLLRPCRRNRYLTQKRASTTTNQSQQIFIQRRSFEVEKERMIRDLPRAVRRRFHPTVSPSVSTTVQQCQSPLRRYHRNHFPRRDHWLQVNHLCHHPTEPSEPPTSGSSSPSVSPTRTSVPTSDPFSPPPVVVPHSGASVLTQAPTESSSSPSVRPSISFPPGRSP
eukprot:scaffold7551_cov168-Amphora_coffeaeformis.AAC.2